MNKLLGGLSDWNLTEDNVKHLKNIASVRIHLAFPDYKTVFSYAPAKRRQEIARILRKEFFALKLFLKDTPVKPMGSSIKPRGAKVDLPLDQVWKLLQKEFVGSISIETIAGFEKKEPQSEACYWSIKARFAIQIEEQERGLQKYEDRIVLIRGLDVEDAQQKLLKSFKNYEEPYLNSSGRLVRWKFEAFLDAYSTSIYSIEDFSSEQGVEVFSELRSRKIKPEHIWKVNK